MHQRRLAPPRMWLDHPRGNSNRQRGFVERVRVDEDPAVIQRLDLDRDSVRPASARHLVKHEMVLPEPLRFALHRREDG